MLTDEELEKIRFLLKLAQQQHHIHLATALLVERHMPKLLDEIDALREERQVISDALDMVVDERDELVDERCALRAERDKLLLELVP